MEARLVSPKNRASCSTSSQPILLTGRDNLPKRDWLHWRRSDESTISGVMILSPDFKDFFASLNGASVRYLVVGGYAVALHGHPRYTKNIDVWVGLDEENAGRLVQALENSVSARSVWQPKTSSSRIE
jgi:hypothetical protein